MATRDPCEGENPVIGTWSRTSRGTIKTTIPKAYSHKRGKLAVYKADHLGSIYSEENVTLDEVSEDLRLKQQKAHEL